MHSSRMRTVRCSGCLGGGGGWCLPRGCVCPRGACPGDVCLPWGVYTTTPPNKMTDGQVYKHNLSAITVAGGKYSNCLPPNFEIETNCTTRFLNVFNFSYTAQVSSISNWFHQLTLWMEYGRLRYAVASRYSVTITVRHTWSPPSDSLAPLPVLPSRFSSSLSVAFCE